MRGGGWVGGGGGCSTAAVEASRISVSQQPNPRNGELWELHSLKLGPAGSRDRSRFGFSGVGSRLTVSAGAHDPACITFTLVKRCSAVLNHNRNSKHFQASQPDELTIEEQEILEVIDDGDMEDWLKVGSAPSD